METDKGSDEGWRRGRRKDLTQRAQRSERRGRREKLRRGIATDARRRGKERREIFRPRSRAQDDGFDARAERSQLQVSCRSTESQLRPPEKQAAATLRSRTAGSQDESRCSAIH